MATADGCTFLKSSRESVEPMHTIVKPSASSMRRPSNQESDAGRVTPSAVAARTHRGNRFVALVSNVVFGPTLPSPPPPPLLLASNFTDRDWTNECPHRAALLDRAGEEEVRTTPLWCGE